MWTLPSFLAGIVRVEDGGKVLAGLTVAVADLLLPCQTATVEERL